VKTFEKSVLGKVKERKKNERKIDRNKERIKKDKRVNVKVSEREG
jgi:hypothetical protein